MKFRRFWQSQSYHSYLNKYCTKYETLDHCTVTPAAATKVWHNLTPSIVQFLCYFFSNKSPEIILQRQHRKIIQSVAVLCGWRTPIWVRKNTWTKQTPKHLVFRAQIYPHSIFQNIFDTILKLSHIPLVWFKLGHEAGHQVDATPDPGQWQPTNKRSYMLVIFV